MPQWYIDWLIATLVALAEQHGVVDLVEECDKSGNHRRATQIQRTYPGPAAVMKKLC